MLYDAAADRSWILGEAGMRLLHGNGDTVVYLQIAEDGTNTIHVADVAFTAAPH